MPAELRGFSGNGALAEADPSRCDDPPLHAHGGIAPARVVHYPICSSRIPPKPGGLLPPARTTVEETARQPRDPPAGGRVHATSIAERIERGDVAATMADEEDADAIDRLSRRVLQCVRIFGAV